MNRAAKHPTWTHLVEETLRTADDFVSFEDIKAATGANRNQTSAALHHLQSRKVVDAVSVQGVPFWFYTGLDTRIYTVEERVKEENPRRVRRVTKPVAT